MAFLKNLKRYSYDLFIYICNIFRSIWGVLLPIALMFGIKFLPWELNNLVRYVGLFLEVLGLYTVIVGHFGKRKLFDIPTLFTRIKFFLAQYPKWKAITHFVSGSYSGASSVASRDNGSTWHEARETNIEGRLEAIEKNLFSLRGQIDIFERETIKSFSDFEKKFESEQQCMNSGISEIHMKLKDFAVQDIGFEGLGIYWLFCGLFLSSLATEVAKLLS